MTDAGTRPGRSFDEVFESIRDVQGWMTRDQAARLWRHAAECRPGHRIVEIGSYQGRSAIVLASAAPDGVEVVAIDPHGGNDRGPQQIEGELAEGQADHEQFVANLERAGVRDRIRHVRKPSQEATGDVPGDVQLLYIDGAHRYAPAAADIRRWGRKVGPRGTMLIHDSFSSVGVTLAQMVVLFLSPRFRYIGRSQSMTEYERVDLTLLDRVANAFRQSLELPYFVRNLLIKVLITARLGRLTRLLGGDGTWPY
ncbi:MAG: class I SAM-dependent methyltransferase [Acidimicrobiales bacterium]|nr:class I SAM-dependent methyltransferase [Acidimicrobiales bacterium]